MCGRYSLTTPRHELEAFFNLSSVPALKPRYNIAPTQGVAVVRIPTDGKQRELTELRWGLIPSWAKDKDIGVRMINARAETVADKPSFRAAFKRRRCLVVADGFYEWQKVDKGKQPFHIRMKDRTPFAIAGLWERWEKGDEPIESCTLITTSANTLLKPVHHRMPVILEPKQFDLWLDPQRHDREELQQMLQSFAGDLMEAVPVGKKVNNPKNDDSTCLEPAEDAGPKQLILSG